MSIAKNKALEYQKRVKKIRSLKSGIFYAREYGLSSSESKVVELPSRTIDETEREYSFMPASYVEGDYSSSRTYSDLTREEILDRLFFPFEDKYDANGFPIRKLPALTKAQEREAFADYYCSKYLTEPVRSQIKRELIDYEGFYVSPYTSDRRPFFYRCPILGVAKFYSDFAVNEYNKQKGTKLQLVKVLRCNIHQPPPQPSANKHFVTFETSDGQIFEAVVLMLGFHVLSLMRSAVHYPKVSEIYDFNGLDDQFV